MPQSATKSGMTAARASAHSPVGPKNIFGSAKGTLAPQAMTSSQPATRASTYPRVTSREAAAGMNIPAPALQTCRFISSNESKSGACQRVGILCGETPAPPAHARFAGGAALARRASSVPGCARPHWVGGRPAPTARCHRERVTRVAGGPRRAGREPDQAGTGGAGAGLAAKKSAFTPPSATPSGS